MDLLSIRSIITIPIEIRIDLLLHYMKDRKYLTDTGS
jgi:hypothetical protein